MHILIENEGLLRMKNGQPLFMNDLQFFKAKRDLQMEPFTARSSQSNALTTTSRE